MSLSVTQNEEQVKRLSKTRHSVEFFHIYTDEKIEDTHRASINYLKAAAAAWNFDYDLILLIDNYNPKEHILDTTEVFEFLENQNVTPHFWAYEADMTANAQVLLDNLTNRKLQKEYLRYIETHNKYPCSLLTAAWYLTRLGQLDSGVIKSTDGGAYTPATRLINILPIAYKGVELRAQELLRKSTFYEYQHNIQDLFYPADAHRKIDLF